MVIASKNKGKINEIRQILETRGIELCSAFDYPELGEIEETGSTLKENALIKAKETFRITGQPSLADDSGLEVEALDGRPGVHSSRYAGFNADDAQNVEKLLEELSSVRNPADRKARFISVLAYIDAGGVTFFEGVCEGRIATSRRGASGFGYDPVFIPDGKDITYAEMPSVEKNRISHRGKAVAQFRDFIRNR